MTRSMRFSSWPATLLLLAGCAPQNDFSSVSTAPITMACDRGRTFTVAYANNFENALIETDGQRLELPRIRSASSMTPTRPGFDSRSSRGPFDSSDGRGMGGGRDDFGGLPGGLDAAGTTGVRYGNDEALFISRNQAAVLQLGDETYSNCQVARV